MMYTLHHGDCLDILPTLAAQSVDAVIADPPYGTTACKWDSVIPFDAMWRELKRIIKPRGAIVLFGSQPFTSALVMSWPQGFKYELTWDKNETGTPGVAKYRPLPIHENILVFSENTTTYNPVMSKGEPYHVKSPNNGNRHGYGFSGKPYEIINNGVRFPTSIIKFARIRHGQHETQKPLALMEYLVKTYTNPADTVLDFTMGSGTTGEACINTGRDFIGIERDKGYYDIASKRLSDAAARLHQLELEVA